MFLSTLWMALPTYTVSFTLLHFNSPVLAINYSDIECRFFLLLLLFLRWRDGLCFGLYRTREQNWFKTIVINISSGCSGDLVFLLEFNIHDTNIINVLKFQLKMNKNKEEEEKEKNTFNGSAIVKYGPTNLSSQTNIRCSVFKWLQQGLL